MMLQLYLLCDDCSLAANYVAVLIVINMICSNSFITWLHGHFHHLILCSSDRGIFNCGSDQFKMFKILQ